MTNKGIHMKTITQNPTKESMKNNSYKNPTKEHL
jgi:hypothetical protein